MKKFINQAQDVVTEGLKGLALAHPHMLTVHYDPTFVMRADAPIQTKVAVVSGGGSGHEPLHNGYVGVGMLDAACPGEVFTSPTPDQILQATVAVHGGAGVVYIVKNYTGDVMNFDMAADLAKAENINIETVLINDDVAVQDSTYTAGRRGVGATIFAEKLCGASAMRGDDLDTVAEVGRRVNANSRSMGVALTSCVVPTAGQPTFELAESEMEVGIGIHGEPGRERTSLKSADEVAEILAKAVIEDLPFQRGDEVIVLLNGMGGTPLIELYVLFNRVAQICHDHGIIIVRNLVGNYITSLEMAGASFTMMKVDTEMLTLWDAPVKTPALRWGAVS